jgi:hypothetical protein
MQLPHRDSATAGAAAGTALSFQAHPSASAARETAATGSDRLDSQPHRAVRPDRLDSSLAAALAVPADRKGAQASESARARIICPAIQEYRADRVLSPQLDSAAVVLVGQARPAARASLAELAPVSAATEARRVQARARVPRLACWDRVPAAAREARVRPAVRGAAAPVSRHRGLAAATALQDLLEACQVQRLRHPPAATEFPPVRERPAPPDNHRERRISGPPARM